MLFAECQGSNESTKEEPAQQERSLSGVMLPIGMHNVHCFSALLEETMKSAQHKTLLLCSVNSSCKQEVKNWNKFQVLHISAVIFAGT